MIIYFDESYDNAHDYLLYGALLVPSSSRLHQRVSQIRAEAGLLSEIKYSTCKNNFRLGVCKKVVDAFIDDSAYFRCVLVEQHGFDYSGFGRTDEPLALKKARAYKKFAEMLLDPHRSYLENAVFLADVLKRCSGDQFLESMRECFNTPGGRIAFRHLDEVPSDEEQYQCLQVCDLLLGCVLNNLKPAKKDTKNQIRKYLCARLGVRNFLPSTWRTLGRTVAADPTVKFNSLALERKNEAQVIWSC